MAINVCALLRKNNMKKPCQLIFILSLSLFLTACPRYFRAPGVHYVPAPRLYAPAVYAPVVPAPRVYAPAVSAPHLYAPRLHAPRLPF
jgi:hypothetical protein